MKKNRDLIYVFAKLDVKKAHQILPSLHSGALGEERPCALPLRKMLLTGNGAAF